MQPATSPYLFTVIVWPFRLSVCVVDCLELSSNLVSPFHPLSVEIKARQVCQLFSGLFSQALATRRETTTAMFIFVGWLGEWGSYFCDVPTRSI